MFGTSVTPSETKKKSNQNETAACDTNRAARRVQSTIPRQIIREVDAFAHLSPDDGQQQPTGWIPPAPAGMNAATRFPTSGSGHERKLFQDRVYILRETRFGEEGFQPAAKNTPVPTSPFTGATGTKSRSFHVSSPISINRGTVLPQAMLREKIARGLEQRPGQRERLPDVVS